VQGTPCTPKTKIVAHHLGYYSMVIFEDGGQAGLTIVAGLKNLQPAYPPYQKRLFIFRI
jgi:hypothetical protein